MKLHHLRTKIAAFFLLGFSSFLLSADSQPSSPDAEVMLALKKSLNPPETFGWSDPDSCKWARVSCSENKRVIRIQLGRQSLNGTLPESLSNLTQLERLELQWNSISGPLPSLKGLNSLQVLILSGNQFSSIPADFFSGMTSLMSVEIDENPFSAWEIPESLKNCSTLQNFSANSANITGKIPGFFGPDAFPSLVLLHLALNNLNGELPLNFSGWQLESVWLNGQNLTGGIDVIQNMTFLKDVWLHSNGFSGPLPDFSGLKGLEILSIRDNAFTGPVPVSLVNLESLKVVNLTNNLLQGPMPKFNDTVLVDMTLDTNSFCLPKPGDCDPRVNALLLILKSVDYPRKFADNWKGNDPCADWFGITCNNGNITTVNFENMGLTGTISSGFALLKSLQRLVLANNNLTGTIPEDLTTLSSLSELDVSNNNLYGKVPSFRNNLIVKTNGNPNIGKKSNSTSPRTSSQGTSDSSSSGSDGSLLHGRRKSRNRVGIVIFSIIGSIFVLCLIGIAAFCLYRSKQKHFNRVRSPNAIVVHPHHSGSDNESVKITVAGSSVSVGAISDTHTIATSETSDIQMVEAGNMHISVQILKNVTNNFSEENILGQGGFGTVYKGALHDGTEIAVKRMESGVLTAKRLDEFKSEITVLTKVRHRHLVALIGYCLDGNEKLLVYEYMPQGTLTRHLLNWASEGLKPLGWTKRLTIALDVARGVEYLHGLAHQSFIHRDLKPSNILLGDDMRAKVGDFGLVRLAPEGKGSIETRIAGTFGYLAPEYAVTGRVTTKVDVFSFGVILMELITGRKALDESQTEESVHLVTWFRRVHLNKDMFRKAIDPTIDLNEETLASINTVAELAGHCCAREPYQRPEMGHAVNVLSSLVELWRPSGQSTEDIYGIDLEMSLPQALKKWQAEGGSHVDSSSSSYLPSLDNTQTSIPTRPYGFAESFTSSDGR
ncbi:hypothetical protein ACH5RR_012086 [Cinchona calisaya]|uniref:non-specific serine/threonine protein kinase n=1 Tax=Cinchona calisaya TaxID=153742 RepID=A0ABD3AAD2_9GENT